LHTAPRTADATGTSSESSTELRITFSQIFAVGGATANDEALGLHTAPRTATGTGTSGQTAIYDIDPVEGITAGYWGIQALVN